MDGTTEVRKRRRFWWLLALPPAACLLLIGGLAGLAVLSPRTAAGDIDLRLPIGLGPGSMTLQIGATTSAPPGKRKVTVGLNFNSGRPATPVPVAAPPSTPTADEPAPPEAD